MIKIRNNCILLVDILDLLPLKTTSLDIFLPLRFELHSLYRLTDIDTSSYVNYEKAVTHFMVLFKVRLELCSPLKCYVIWTAYSYLAIANYFYFTILLVLDKCSLVYFKIVLQTPKFYTMKRRTSLDSTEL